MLGLPEIDDLICQRMRPHDLAQSAQVSKEWHATVIRHLWRDLTCLDFGSRKQLQAFRSVVLEDYLDKNQQQYHAQHEEEHVTRRHIQVDSSQSLSALSKYGHWIQMLPNMGRLFIALAPKQQHHYRLQRSANWRKKEPSAHDLALHLFGLCHPEVQVACLTLEHKGPGRPSDPWDDIVEFTIPRVCHLQVSGSFTSRHSEYSKLKDRLNRCSTRLKSLDLCVNITDDGTKDADNRLESDRLAAEQMEWTCLRELSLEECSDTSVSKEFWKWLWKKCSQVERLDVEAISTIVPSLVDGMSNHMPHLSEIILGRDDDDGPFLPDDQVAALLSGSRAGWKRVEVSESAAFEKASMAALVKHFSTLEELDMDGPNGVTGVDMVKILRSCSRLCTLINTDMFFRHRYDYPYIDPITFIDRDLSTGKLREWACKDSLKVFKVKISGIPRPDLAEFPWVEEVYPGHSLNIQRQVYERLGQLTSLELLWLGDQCYYENNLDKAVPDHQPNCLEMSLESGLSKLSGLKALQELSISGMTTRIGVAEVQWMTENWPKLKVIYGIDNMECKAQEWLWEHHPNIRVLRLTERSWKTAR